MASTAPIPVWGRKNGESYVRAYARVDLADYEQINQRRWNMHPNSYVVRHMRLEDGRNSVISMHREIMGCAHGDGTEVDHIDRDPLNNTRANLRFVTHAENHQNVGSRPGSSSKYRGVTWSKARGKWQVYIRSDGKYHWLGYHIDEDVAGRIARDFIARTQPFSQEARDAARVKAA